METIHPVDGYFGSEFRAVCNHAFLLAFQSNYVLILQCFWDIAWYWSKIADFNLPHVYGAAVEGASIGISSKSSATEN